MFKVSCLCLRDEARKWSLRLFSIEQLETNRVLRSLSAIQRRKAIRKMFSELTKNDLDVLASRAVLYQQRVESGNPHPLDHEAMREIKRKEKLESRANLINYSISVSKNNTHSGTSNSSNSENNMKQDTKREGAKSNLSSSSSSSLFSSSSSAVSQLKEGNTESLTNELAECEPSTSINATSGEMHKRITNKENADDVLTPEMIKEITPFEFFVKEQKNNPSTAAITSEEERVAKLREIFDTLPDTAREVIAKNAHEYAVQMARRRLAAAKARRVSKESTRSTQKGKRARKVSSKSKKSKKDKKKKGKNKNKKGLHTGRNSSSNSNNSNNSSSDSSNNNHKKLVTTDAKTQRTGENSVRKPSAYTLFVKDQMLSVKHLPNKERLVEISRRWKALSDVERSGWAPEHSVDQSKTSRTTELADHIVHAKEEQKNDDCRVEESAADQHSEQKSETKDNNMSQSELDNHAASKNEPCDNVSCTTSVLNSNENDVKQAANAANSTTSTLPNSPPISSEFSHSSSESASKTTTTATTTAEANGALNTSPSLSSATKDADKRNVAELSLCDKS